MLEKAHAVVADQASAIGDAAHRSAYLDLKLNREIEAAHSNKQWPIEQRRKRRSRSKEPSPGD
jgi:hypothetical protein